MDLFTDIASRKEPCWYGYIHINGNLQIKRYFVASDIIKAKESHFVSDVTPKIESMSREDAVKKAIIYFIEQGRWQYRNGKFERVRR